MKKEDIKQVNPKSRKFEQGDPFWFDPFLTIINTVGSIAGIIGLIIQIKQLKKAQEDYEGIRNEENRENRREEVSREKEVNWENLYIKIQDLRSLFRKYRESSRRLFNLLDDNVIKFSELNLKASEMNFNIDKDDYPIYGEIKSELRKTNQSIINILDEMEEISVNLGIGKPSSETGLKLLNDIDQILDGWGEASLIDVIAGLNEFNKEVEKAFQELIHE
jgi:hypothetical protein